MKPVLVLLLCLSIAKFCTAAPREFIQLNMEERQARVEELRDEIKRLDARIEKKIDQLQERFLVIKDSDESGITVQQTKEKLIDGLGRLAGFYKTQRDLFLREVERTWPRADRETMNKVAAAFDEHIDKRVNQVVMLNNSLSAPDPDSKKGSEKQIARRTEAQQNATREALQGIISRLKQENTNLAAQLAYMSDRDAAMIRETIADNDGRIKRREDQLKQLDAGGPTASQALSKSEALELRKALDAAATDIKEDSYRLSNLVIEYAQEEEAVRRLQEELDRQPPAPERAE